MMEQEKTEVTTTDVVKGTTTIGFKSLTRDTPMWVTWIFRTEFVLNKAITLFYYDDLTPQQVKLLLFIDFCVWGFGRFVGIKKPDEVTT